MSTKLIGRIVALAVVACCLLGSSDLMAAPLRGVVYDAKTGTPISGVRLQLFYDDNDLSEPGLLVPADRLPNGEQNQVSGTDGDYAFELPVGRVYRLEVGSVADHASFPSGLVPPRSGFANSGEIGDGDAPSASGDRPFYLRFDATNDNARFLNNHIAVDQVGDRVTLDLRANRASATLGDILSFSATFANASNRNLREAEGKGLYLAVTSARGISINPDSVRATVRSETGLPVGQPAGAVKLFPTSDRQMRIGPFDVPAGSTLEVKYHATVGIDLKPGRFTTRMVGVDRLGIVLSPEATVDVAITNDRDLSTSTVLGRVFCDEDGDGVQGRRERGLYGAKVYAAMGSVATTDAAGRFHLTRIVPGAQVFKIDEGSLGGGRVLGKATRLLVLSEGLPMQLSFPVACAQRWVGSKHARVVLPLAAPSQRDEEEASAEPEEVPTMEVRGRIQPMTLSIDGRRRDLPSASLREDFPQGLIRKAASSDSGPVLSAVPKGGFASNMPRWSVVWNRADLGATKSWRFTIESAPEKGVLRPVVHRSGTGAPPRVMTWNGLGDSGAPASAGLYVARFTIASERGVEVASRRLAFAFEGQSEGTGATKTVLRGPLFTGKGANLKATAKTRLAIAKIAETLGSSGTVEISVHSDGRGDRLKAAAQTQSEAKYLSEQFQSYGVAAARITARGRGASEPVASGTGAQALAENRRIVFSVRAPTSNAAVSVPRWVAGAQELRIAGRLTPIDAEGGFRTEVPRPANGLLAVDMLAASGRRVAFPLNVGEKLRVDTEAGVAKTFTVAGDLSKAELQVDFTKVPAELWAANAQLVAVGSLPIPEVATDGEGEARSLQSPLDVTLRVSEKLSVKHWELVFADASTNEVVHRIGGDGAPPPVQRWDGRDDSGTLLLKSGSRYRYWLDVETADSSGVSTEPRWFVVDPSESGTLLAKRARLFTVSGTARATLKNLLSRFAAKASKAPEEYYAITLEVVGDAPRVEMVRKGFVAYLAKLGIGGDRYSLVARELVGTRDQIAIVRDARPSAKAPEVRINRRRVALAGTTFKEEVKLPPGVPIVVEVQSARGAVLRYVDGQSTERAGSGDELIAPSPAALPPKPRELRDDEILASTTPAKSLRVLLPPKGQVLGASEVAIVGRVRGKNTVRVAGRRVPVDENGSFHAMVPLAIGENTIVIRADDELGGSSTIRWPVEVDETHTIALGMVEGIAATSVTSRGLLADTAGLYGMGGDTTLQVGPLLLSARAQGFIQHRMPGGKISDSIEVTAQIDTARERPASAFFEQVVDPVRTPATFGDQASEQQIANTRGKLYGKVVAGDSSIVIGSVHTRLEGGGELFSYDRTADGAVAHIARDLGESQVAVRAFSTSDAIASVRDVNWFRATGGSLFYLRNGHVLEGSERVQVVVRDRDSGLVLSTSELARGVDYSIEYQGGRVRLTEPLTAANRSSWVLDNMDSSSTPMSGNLVYLSVQYEHQNRSESSQQSRGAYASTTIEDRLSVGAGIVSESRAGEDDYRLLGVDASLNLGKHSHLSAELAASRDRDAGHALSIDGGLTFGDLQRDSAFSSQGDSLSAMHMGWKLSADLALRDWTKAEEFRDTSLSLYLQDVDRGFASGGTVFDQGRLRFGGRLRQRLTRTDMLMVRHEGQIADLARVGPTAADVMDNPNPQTPDERASYITSAQWARDDGDWHYKFELMHQRITSTASLASNDPAIDVRRLGFGTRAAYELSRDVTLHAGQQIVADQGEGDPVLSPVSAFGTGARTSDAGAGLVSNVGGELRLAPELSIGADVFQRWNGDNALRVGLRNALSSRGSMYVQEQVAGVDGGLSSTTIVGAEDRFGADGGGRTYGEYQMNHGVLGNRNRSVLGLGRRWQVTPKLGLGAGFEHQQAFGGFLPDGTAIGNARRNVGHASFTFAPARSFRITGQAELRLDSGDDGSNVDPSVLGQDPRPGQLPGGFADHGGVAQGAALIIAPGEQTQLIGGLAADWQMDARHRWLGRIRASSSTFAPPGESQSTLASFREITTGMALRPIRNDTLEILYRYSNLLEQRPTSGGIDGERLNSHVFAVLPFARLPRRILLSGKLAYKRTAMEESMAASESLESEMNALLAILRVGYQFYGMWDASAEGRVLALWGTSDEERKTGSLLELGRTVGKHLRLGAGYNFSHFSDNELGDLKRDSHGFFFRMTGMY